MDETNEYDVHMRVKIIKMTPAVNTPNTYYVDSLLGSDANVGQIDSPFKTLAKLNQLALKAGDKILLKRGCVWREPLPVKGGSKDGYVTYGSYGDSLEKPILMLSENKSAATDWKLETGNIWTTPFSVDIGNVIFNKNTSVGIRVWKSAELDNQGKYLYDKGTGLLKVWSAKNPATFYSDIECCKTTTIIYINNSNYIIIENLSLCNSSFHGIQITNSNNVIIRNNDISWIGGGKPSWATSDMRLGNGVELYDGAQDVLVDSNRIWHCFDAGLTTQSNNKCVISNIAFTNNIVFNCCYNFEYWHRDPMTTLLNIRYDNNTSLYGGYEWSHSQRLDYGGYDIAYFGVKPSPNSLMMRNNIFYNSCSDSIHIYYTDDTMDNSWMDVIMDYNMYWRDNINDKQQTIIYWKAKEWYFTGNFAKWQNAPQGKDKHGLAAKPLFVNLPAPNLIDIKTLDVHLAPGSQGINAGTVTSALKDFNGNPRNSDGKGIDMGVYES